MYFMYLRKSRKDDELESATIEETLARHERTLLALAHKLDITIDKIYREVVSGETIAARPMMQQMLNDMESGNCDGVLVMEVERLARGNTMDQGFVSQAFQLSNTKIITPMRIYDPQNEADQEYFEFSLFMSRREYKTITRRMQAGRRASFNEGKYTGNTPPYGYNRKKLHNEKGWTLTINENEAQIVRLIFDWYVNGEKQDDGSIEKLGTTTIARKLNKLSIPSRTGSGWTTSALRDLIRNPVYAGYLRSGWRKSQKKLINGKVLRQRPKAEDYLIAKGRHQAIITDELWDTAQEIFKTRGRPISNQQLLNPLAGLIICGKCGKKLQRRPYGNGRIDTLNCPNLTCDNIGSDLPNVEKAVLNALKTWLEKYMLDTDSINKNTDETKLSVLSSNIENLKKKLSTLKTQISNIYDLLEQGIYDIDTFTERSSTLKNQITEIETKINTQEKEYEKEKQIINAHEIIVPKIHGILESYDKMDTITEKNNALCSILEKVTYIKTSRRKKDSTQDTFQITIFPKVPHH